MTWVCRTGWPATASRTSEHRVRGASSSRRSCGSPGESTTARSSVTRRSSAFESARRRGAGVRLMGLLGDGRVHSDLRHLEGLLELSRKVHFPGDRVVVHAFTDGRDTSPNAGLSTPAGSTRSVGSSASVRSPASLAANFAMDRDNRWERIEPAYRMLVHAEGASFANAAEAVQSSMTIPRPVIAGATSSSPRG